MSDKRTRKPPTHRLALRCPVEIYEAIVAAARREHRTVSNMMVELARRSLASASNSTEEARMAGDLLQARTLEALRQLTLRKEHSR